MTERIPMVKVKHIDITHKDFRDYDKLEPLDFTRIHDNDLKRLWDAVNHAYAQFVLCKMPANAMLMRNVLQGAYFDAKPEPSEHPLPKLEQS